ncbi:MAG: polyphenol oxidase family protein [Pseudomonadota bacterium]|nr:polyphenol oxidase family protein [Pseudomonadota bacterium]
MLSPLLSGVSTVRHGFFTRQGGTSWARGDLNCGLGADDDPSHVDENRRRVRDHLPAQALVSLTQTHSTEVVSLTAAPDWPRGRGLEGDGLVTRVPGLALGVLSADCGALLAVDPVAGVIGAAHSGWKGTAGNITRALIDAMAGQGAEPARIRLALGPMIRQASYEVGPEFPDHFRGAVADHERFFRPAARDGHFLGDIAGIIAAQAAAEGVTHFEDIGGDTYADPDRFFSARRSAHQRQPDFGRLISAIALQGGN